MTSGRANGLRSPRERVAALAHGADGRPSSEPIGGSETRTAGRDSATKSVATEPAAAGAAGQAPARPGPAPDGRAPLGTVLLDPTPFDPLLDPPPLDPRTQPIPVVRPPGDGPTWAQRWLPVRLTGWLSRMRLDPGRPGAIALAVVTAAAAVVAAVGVWLDRPVAEPAPPLAGLATSGTIDAAGSGSPVPSSAVGPATLVVFVVGKVAKPGLVQVPDGARVADALAAAGGALPGTDLLGLNLARRVADGEQVAVGIPQPPDAGPAAAPGSPPTGRSGGGGTSGRVDLNRATPEQLDALPGVGAVTAQRIVEWRAKHGRFGRIEQLREVEGIGERRFAQLRELVTV